MEKDKKKKRWLPFVIVVLILIVTLGLILWGILAKGRDVEAAGYIRLNQRDIAIDVGETAELEIAEIEAAFELADAEVKWISDDTSVASVDENGIVTGEAGGEARITAVAKNGGKEYTSSCIVTVKATGLEYSSYQIHWYTQRKDLNGYEVSVETYERLVGSEVNLTKLDAKAKLPGYYVLNEDKCVLSGTVKESKAGCVLKVYYDVAEISYAVDYYYESGTALGTYELKETKQYKAYAFSEVNAPLEVAEGFVVNKEAKGSVLTEDSVVSKTKLKVYCDRIRSEVTIKYASGRQKDFKAVIQDDIFSLWVEDKLVWKLPLTNEKFGGFKAGTSYRFALRCLDKGGKAEWSNLTVKYGENVAKSKFEVAVKPDGMLADASRGKVTVNLKDDKVNHLWFATDNKTYSSKSWEITGSFKQLESLVKGFTIQSADGNTTGFYTMWTGGVSLNQNWGYPVKGGWNVYSADGKYVFANADYDDLCNNPTQVTYENAYGVGLVGAPADALEESLAPYETAAYISGKMVEDIQSAVKELTEDAKVEFKVAGRGFTYQKDGSLLEDYYNVASSAYAYLQGSGKTIYLSANYNLTGSATNMSGITLRSGDENRQILFNNQGVVVLKNYKWEAGTVSKKAFEFNHGNGSEYILVQNRTGLYETKINSVIQNMITDTEASSHDLVWAVWEGTLYCSVDGIVAVRLPLNQLVESWTADTEFEIGFAAYDGAKIGDEFTLRDVDVQYNDDAEDMLHTDGKATDLSEIYMQTYDPLSGTYIPISIYGATWMYGTETAENSGITADVTWMDKDNTGTMIGVSVRMGDASVQYYIRGQNWSYQTLNNHKGDSHRSIDIKRINSGTPFDENGSCKMGAYVKDGYFYVTYNGIQVQCINMLSLFQDYTKDSEVSVGICTMETCVGLAYIENIEVLDEDAVAEQQDLTEWHFYSEEIYGQPTKCDFAEGTIVKDKAGYHEAALLGSSEAWHVKGVMKRTDAKNAGDLLMGFVISSGGKSMSLYGHNNGFVYNWKFSYNGGTNLYAFGDSHGQFFNSTRNIDELPFEMVIYEDILYVYLDGELSWRIPLTEEQFGFEKGSRYKVKISMVDPDRKGAIEDIEVRMGYQVTEETEFMTYKGTNYSLKRAMSKTEANVEKYQDIDNVYWRGNLLEEITFTTKEGQAYLTTEGDEYQGLKTAIVQQAGESGSLYNGIILKSGEDTARIIVDSRANVLILQQSEKSSTAKAFSESTSAYVDDKCELAVVVKDEKLFVTANDTPLGAIELKELLENYKKGDEITFGICSDNSNPGVVGFADITTLTGNEEGIEYTDSNMQLTDVKFMVADTTNGMKADSLNGKVTVNLTDGQVNTLYFATDNATNSSKNWEITGTFKQLAGLMKGFTIQSADGTKSGYYTMWTGGVALNERWGSPVAGGWNVYSAYGQYVFVNADYDALSGNNVAKKFKVIIRDDIFSFFVEDKLVWQLPLTSEKFGGFAAGTSYRFALRCLDNGGKAEWSDLTVKYGKNVGKYKFLVGSMSNHMTADTMNGTVTTNMTGDKATNHLYFATNNATNSSKSWEITGTFEQIKAGLMNGFTIQSADGNTTGYYTMYEQSVALNEKWGWPITGNAWNTHSVDGQYVFANSDYEDIADYGTINKAKKFKAVIKDDVFSFYVEDKLVWQLPLTDARFGGFTAGTSYRFALRHRDEGGQAEWSNLTVKYGEDVGAYKFQVASMTNGVTVDRINGKIIADHASTAVRNLYFATDNETNSSTSWEITGTMTQSGSGLKLFTIQSADGTKTEYYTMYDKALIKNEKSPWDWRYPSNYPDYVFNNPSYVGVSYTHNPLKFKAVIENDIFSLWIEDQLAWSVPLTNEKFGGFAAGTSYRIAIGSTNGSGGGQAEWSDLTVKYGK